MSFRISIKPGSDNQNVYYSQGVWRGNSVLVRELLYDEQGPCPGHELELLKHFDDPTGALWCPNCCGVAAMPDEAA